MNQIEFAISAILKTSLHQSEKGQAILAVLSTEQSATKQPQFKLTKNPPQDTFVYLIENEQGHIKIGFSGNPEKRLSQLKTACPSAKLIHKFSGTMQDEKHLQSLFAEKNIDKEWFRLDSADIEEIKDYFRLKILKKGRGKSVGIEFQVIDNAFVSGDFFKFKDMASIRNLVDYSRYISPNNSGIGKDTASVYMAMLKERNRPLSKRQWESKK